jgi:hypothetical protein
MVGARCDKVSRGWEGANAPGLWSQSGSDRKRDAHALRQTCNGDRPGARPVRIESLRQSWRQRAESGGKVGRVAITANRRQRASQLPMRCDALSSHRTSDVPVSGCAIGENVHVGCGCCSSGRCGAAVGGIVLL